MNFPRIPKHYSGIDMDLPFQYLSTEERIIKVKDIRTEETKATTLATGYQKVNFIPTYIHHTRFFKFSYVK